MLNISYNFLTYARSISGQWSVSLDFDKNIIGIGRTQNSHIGTPLSPTDAISLFSVCIVLHKFIWFVCNWLVRLGMDLAVLCVMWSQKYHQLIPFGCFQFALCCINVAIVIWFVCDTVCNRWLLIKPRPILSNYTLLKESGGTELALSWLYAIGNWCCHYYYLHVFVIVCNVGAVQMVLALLEKNLVGGNTLPSTFSSHPSISLS